MSFEFQSKAYNSAREMCAAIVSAWMFADKGNDTSDVAEILGTDTDDEIVDGLVRGWELDEVVNEDGVRFGDEPYTWLELQEATRADLVRAVAEFRREFLDRRDPARAAASLVEDWCGDDDSDATPEAGEAYVRTRLATGRVNDVADVMPDDVAAVLAFARPLIADALSPSESEAA